MEHLPKSLNILLIDDSNEDAINIIQNLKNGGFRPNYTVCKNIDEIKDTLKSKNIDLILCDYFLNGFSAIEAFDIYLKSGLFIPFIIVSNDIEEGLAVEAMRLGVHDYVLKDRLERLIPVIKRELMEARLRQEQVEVYETLENERHNFHSLIEHAPIGITIVTNTGIITYINKMFESIFEYSISELTSIDELIPKVFLNDQDQGWMQDYWKHVFNPKKSLPELEYPMIRSKSGRPKFVKLKTAPVNEDTFILMTEDITNQKLASISLQNNQKRLTQIFNTVEDIIIELYIEENTFKVNNTNHSFHQATGLIKRQVLDQNIETIFNQQFDIVTQIRRSIKKRKTLQFEETVDFTYGQRFWEFFISPIYSDDDKLYRVLIDARDLTERKEHEIKLQESEKKFRNISSIATDAIWEWSSLTNHIEWNEGFNKLFGYELNEVGRSPEWYVNIVHPEDINHTRQSLRYSLHNKMEKWDTEFKFRCKDNTYKHVHLVATIYYTNTKKPLKMIGVIVDLSLRLRADEVRIQSLVDGADEERRIIAEELHDNLGQKLFLSKVLIEQLKNKYKDDLIDKALIIMDNAVTDTRNISHNLLPKTVRDYGLKAAVLALIDTIKIGQPLEINSYFNFDGDRFKTKIENNLYRIIQECFSNIIKHSKANTVFLHMMLTEEMLSLTIEDNGVGFDTTNSKKQKGIGLKNIEHRVYYLKGNLTVETNKNTGTLFLIEVPIH